MFAFTCVHLHLMKMYPYLGHSLLQFLRRCAEHYLGSEQKEVRVESVRTCSRLLCLAIESPQSKTSHTVRYTISTVIKQILIVGVSDTGKYLITFYTVKKKTYA